MGIENSLGSSDFSVITLLSLLLEVDVLSQEVLGWE